MALTAEEFIRKKKRKFEENKNREVRVKDISRTGRHIWRCEAQTFMRQSGYPEKVFVVERFRYVRGEGKLPPRHSSQDPCEYRVGYFIVAKVGKRKGNWWWGQFCPFIPSQDFHQLIRRAEQEGTILKR